jgi:hypothetical protein
MESAHTSEWLEELQQRKTWYCDIDEWEGDEDFTTAKELEQHIKSEHGERVPNVAVASMLQQNTRLSWLGLTYCPICNESVGICTLAGKGDLGEVSSLDIDPESDKMLMVNHIAGHLKELAQISMKGLNELEEGSKSDINTIDDASKKPAYQAPMPHSLDVEWSGRTDVGTAPPSLLSNSNNDPNLGLQLRDMPEMLIETACDANFEDNKQSNQSLSTRISQSSTTSRKRMTWRELGQKIHMSKVESAFDGKRFVPRNAIEELITPTNIQDILSPHFDDQPGPIIDFIASEARIFFAIMVSIMRPGDLILAINTLHRFRLTDRFLPIRYGRVKDHCDVKWRGCDHCREFNAFHEKPWDLLTLSQLHDRQWEFVVPVFGGIILGHNLNRMGILPFEYLGTECRSGPFSNVYEVRIHRAHQKFYKKVNTRHIWSECI